MEDFNCIWIDIVEKNSNIDDYMSTSDILDEICYQNVKSSLMRLNAFHHCVVLYYKNHDIAVVILDEFQYNTALKKSVSQFQKHLVKIANNLTNEKTIEVLYNRLNSVLNSIN